MSKKKRSLWWDIVAFIVSISFAFLSFYLTRQQNQKLIEMEVGGIVEEMEENIQNIRNIDSLLREEGLFFEYLSSASDVRKLSLDTLEMRRNMFFQTDSLDLKRIQWRFFKKYGEEKIKNEELVLRINKVYESMFSKQKEFKVYSDYKHNTVVEVLENVPEEDWNRFLEEKNTYEYYMFFLRNEKMKDFIYTHKDNLWSEEDISELLKEVEEVIDILNKEYIKKR